MGRYVIQLDDKWYLVWSSVVDAPITYGLAEDGLLEWIKDEYGATGLHWWERTKQWIPVHGTNHSSHTLDDILACNHAGPNETELTEREIITAYCERKPIGEWHA